MRYKLVLNLGAGIKRTTPGCPTKMAALAILSSEADDVFEAVAEKLRKVPFDHTLTAEDLRGGRDLRALLFEVCADIDGARTPATAADAVALLTVLGAPVDEATARDVQDDDRGTMIACLHWCLRDRATHKKAIYDARLALPIRALAAATASTPVARASTLAFRALKAQACTTQHEVSDAPLIEGVVEVGVPHAWDAAQLLTIATADTNETRLQPKRTVAQRWAAAVRKMTGSKKHQRRSPPAEAIHPTEPGVVMPRALWAWPRSCETDDIAPFCFPEGLRVTRGEGPGPAPALDGEPFVFVQRGGGAAPLYGICARETLCRPLREDHAVLARCVCVLTKCPLLLDLHVAVLRDALAETRHAGDATRRLALREIFGRYRRLEALRPGQPVRFAVAQQERMMAMPALDEALTFLGDGWRHLRPILEWTRRDYGAIAACAATSVPRLFQLLPARTCLRALAAVLCELQVVVVATAPEAAAACVHGLAALCRPVLVVGARAPVLPTQLHALLEAPVPFLVGAPRTETWARCLENRLPRPGLLIVDADRGALAYHPDDADLVELPEARAVEDAIEDLVKACQHGDGRAGRHCGRVVGRHVAKLCGAAKPFEASHFKRTRQSIVERARGRESLEFAKLVKRELGERRERASVNDLRESVGHAFEARAPADLVRVDARASAAWARASTHLDLRASIRADPLRKAFFERLAESQAYAVYRENFPTLFAEASPSGVKEDVASPRALCETAWRPASPGCPATPPPRSPSSAFGGDISPLTFCASPR